jgi:anaerobic selenocysteine-containing dehydrogenase
MDHHSIDLKDQGRTLKSASLMGPLSGPPVVVYSADGKITRVRPYYYGEGRNIEELNPWKIEARGKTFGAPDHTLPSPLFLSYKKRVYSRNRVSYPLKRVDWDPRGQRNPQNRGKSGYVRISWDEATQIIADELLRVKEKYGMSAVLSEADVHGEGKHIAPSHGANNRLLSLLGGYTIQMRNMDSWEGYTWGSRNVWGCEPVGEMQPSANLYSDIARHTELLLFWGCDPETTPLGIDGMMASRLCYWLSDLGIKCVYVDPALNYGAAVHADKWIPIKPNTDAALYLAIAYIWLTEGTYDKEYVKTHTVGADPFFEYVLGKTDGVPKTPTWAAEKCGVPEWTIKALARDWANKITSICIGNGGPGIRGPYSTEPARMQSILLGMQGLGKPGRHQAKMIEWNLHSAVFPLPYQGKVVPRLASRGESLRPPKVYERSGSEIRANAMSIPELKELLEWREPPAQSIPKCMIHDAILNDSISWWGLLSFLGPADEQWVEHKFPDDGCSRIHMVWSDSPCMTTCWNDGFRFVEAMQSTDIECFVVQHPWLENDCLLADIILPVCTKHELADISDDTNGGVFTSVYRETPACPPVAESVSDYEAVVRIARKLSEKLGDRIYQDFTGHEMTDDRLIDLLWQGSGVAHLDTEKHFEKDGIFVMPCDPDIQKVPPGLSEFCNDPENHPLTTPSGKLEFTSTQIKKHFPNDPERPPYPKWIERGQTHDERQSSRRAEKYPLLCMSNHPRWRMHAQCDDIVWNREVDTMKIRASDGYQYEPVWLHPSTSAIRGIKHGDIVKVFNERGIVLGGAYVTERVIQGVAYMDHGSRFDPIDPKGIDRGGAINLISPHAITSKNVTGMAVSGFLVDVQKVTDEEMDGWKKKYPEAFARKIDKDCGVCLSSWLIEQEVLPS